MNFASQINFRVVDLEKALVGVSDYKGLLVNSCAAVVRRLVQQTSLSDDDISARVLADESLQKRASSLGVKLSGLNVSTSNLTESAQLAHKSPKRMRSSPKALKPRARRSPATVHPARSVNDASGLVALTGVDDIAPAA